MDQNSASWNQIAVSLIQLKGLRTECIKVGS